jgi:hypothetical protein
MSKVALSGDAGGTGTVTLAAPNTNSNVTLNLPAVAGTMATAESTLTQFNVTGSAPVYACRAWVNFNGTGTVAIRASGNVSSITDNGTGDYTVNFTTAMPDANYAATTNIHGATISDFGSTTITPSDTAPSTTALRLATRAVGGSRFDCPYIFVLVVR